jgi:LmbE family N-acetylglucosaminyl deacetylase
MIQKFFLSVSVLFFACCLSLFAQNTEETSETDPVSILLVTAHPDDDALFSGTIYRLTHEFEARVDLALVTNGEGGYKYSTLGNEIYGLELDKEEVGREFLPGIRKMELMKGGEIVGLRNYFFLDEQDTDYTTDMEIVFTAHWDTARVKQKFRDILRDQSYDYVFTLLPTKTTHGHHKASAVLMMRVIEEMPRSNRPIVLSATIFDEEFPKTTYRGFEKYPITKPMSDTAYVTFNRMQKFGHNDRLTYQIISNWVIAEHKSQGTMQLLMNRGKMEQYWFWGKNNPEDFDKVKALFEKISPQK